MDHDEATIRAFAHPQLAERYLALLRNAKGRKKFRSELAHRFALDARYSTKVPSGNQTAREIAAALRARGAPAMCYCLSEDASLDARQ